MARHKVIPISEIPEDYELVELSQDVQAIDEDLGRINRKPILHGYFVKQENGEIVGAYEFPGSVPLNSKLAIKVK